MIAQKFQSLTTYDLNGKSVTLPDDFKHDFNLLFVAYDQWHQREVDGWVPFAAELESEFENLRFYELPVVGNMNMFGRKQLDFWMRQGIPDQETRGRTLTYYVDRSDFRDMLGIEVADHIAVVLVDQAGTVLWKTYGVFAPEKSVELKGLLDQLAS